ncbi:uncharacterized protein LOC118802460 [Scomber scombrus]|uniref:Uncharacterized protein LOC118802460 n=1 Tax=Scomber scombrus TaxID=13677 RepID=A0AAV1Q6F1_SCOSC
MLRILCIFLMMPQMTLQSMDRKEDLMTLIFNMSQKQQGLSQWSVKRQRLQRAVMSLQDNPEIQLDKGVQGQFARELDQNVMKTRVEVALGESIQLPCKCGRRNFGGNNSPKWINSRGEDVVLAGPEVDTLPPSKRKYVLYNDMWWLRVRGDCSLFLNNATWQDQGEYTCTYLEPEFEFVPLQDYWIEGHIIRKVTLMIKEDTTMEGMSVKTVIGTTLAPVTSGNFNSEVVTRETVNSKTVIGSLTSIKSVKTTQTPVMTTFESKQVVNVTQKPMTEASVSRGNDNPEIREQVVEKNDEDLSETAQRTISDVENDFLEVEGSSEEVTLHYHALQKRETEWKAYGFDSSTLQIADPLAGRNLWFQQLTHSVRSVRKVDGPCVVRVPTPGTWPSILEAVPEPLATKCQSYALSWLMYQQQSAEDTIMALSVHLFKPRFNCSWLMDLPYMDLLDQHENIVTAVPDAMEVKPMRAKNCFCSNDTHNGPGMFMGISDCDNYMMQFGERNIRAADDLYTVNFHAPNPEQSRTLIVRNQTLPGNVTIGNFKDIWWICADKAYIFLPYGWTGCCYMATLKLPYEVLTIQRGFAPDEVQANAIPGNRRKRAMAKFHNLESYHWRISLGEKWGLGLFPWYGVTFLADHIDNITYTLQGFANETMRGFDYLTNTQRSHRLTLLKHDMALDYVLAKQGGLCVALNLTEEACYTLIPDNSDNMTSVIDALKSIRDAFGPSPGAGWSANAWLQGQLGPMGAALAQVLAAVVISLCMMFCFCTILLTFAKAMILRWVGVVMPGDQAQMPLLHRLDTSEDDEEVVIEGELMETYPF